MEIASESKKDNSVSSTGGWLFKVCFAGAILIALALTYSNFKSGGWRPGLISLGATAAFLILGPVSWSLGDWFRKFIAPDSYLTFGTGDAFKKKIFWLVGPQWTSFLCTFAVVMLFPLYFSEKNSQSYIPSSSASETAQETAPVPAPAQETVPVPFQDAVPAPVQDAVPAPVQDAVPAPVQDAVPAPVPAAKTDAGSTLPAGFTIIAPSESKSLLTSMLLNPMNSVKLAEAKGEIEKIAKPATGDRKAARGFNDKGLEALKAGKDGDATSLLQKAVATDPADIEVRNNYVYALLKSKNIGEAEKEAGTSLTYSPGRSSAWANLAEIYAEKGDTQASTSALIVAFQFSSNKDKTLTFLREKSDATEAPVFSEAAKSALKRLTDGQ
jgi:hypothetical protein